MRIGPDSQHFRRTSNRPFKVCWLRILRSQYFHLRTLHVLLRSKHLSIRRFLRTLLHLKVRRAAQTQREVFLHFHHARKSSAGICAGQPILHRLRERNHHCSQCHIDCADNCAEALQRSISQRKICIRSQIIRVSLSPQCPADCKLRCFLCDSGLVSGHKLFLINSVSLCYVHSLRHSGAFDHQFLFYSLPFGQ